MKQLVVLRVRKKKGEIESKNTARNKATEWNKYIPDELTCSFTTPNETFRRSYFDQYDSTISAGHSERETMAHFSIE